MQLAAILSYTKATVAFAVFWDRVERLMESIGVAKPTTTATAQLTAFSTQSILFHIFGSAIEESHYAVRLCNIQWLMFFKTIFSNRITNSAIDNGEWGGPGSCATRLCQCDLALSKCLRHYYCPKKRPVCVSSPFRLLQNLVMVFWDAASRQCFK